MRNLFASATVERMVEINVERATLVGNLSLPQQARGVVLFAHGSGSSRHSPRNRYVATILNESKIGTLLLDLLTSAEEEADIKTGQLRFDIKLLADRVARAADWLVQQRDTRELPVGCFGASTGAAAALVAAAERPEIIRAVVSRGGRPDLAGSALEYVRAPTLFIVGGHDIPVLELTQQTMDQLSAIKQLEIIPGATHLFEEEGALEQVAQLASQWFIHYFSTAEDQP